MDSIRSLNFIVDLRTRRFDFQTSDYECATSAVGGVGPLKFCQSRGKGHRFYVEGFLILVKPSCQTHGLPDETLDVPGIRHAIGSVVEQLFKVKIIFLLGNLSSEGTKILLLLTLAAVLRFLSVLRLMRTLLLVFAAACLSLVPIHRV